MVSAEAYVKMWQTITDGGTDKWVLFRCGTCVFVRWQHRDLVEAAKDALARFGPVRAQDPQHRQFDIMTHPENPGWVISFYRAAICTYVSLAEVQRGTPNILVGMYGRHKRGMDAKKLEVIHVHQGAMVAA